MSGEKSVLSGSHGEKIMKEFLKLVGWNHISQNVQFGCFLGKKHKTLKGKSDRTNHNIDATFYYNNPLNHAETDIVLCSSKHNNTAYADRAQAYSHLKELAHSLECGPRDFSFTNDFDNINKNKLKVYKGLLFWISSNPDEQYRSIINDISLGLIKDEEEDPAFDSKLKGIDYNSIYLVDNAKATFITSAIKTAQSLYPNHHIQFLFPHTGLNNRTEDLKGYGEIMPIQYINSSILPIVIDQGDKVSVLIFCNSVYEKYYLKRIIWLAHKMSELVGVINIFFNDYDQTKDEEGANRIKQLFENSPLTTKITIRRIHKFDFVTLKEEQQERLIFNTFNNNLKSVDILNKLPNESDLDRILPFGEMIKPIIASSSLSESDLKFFLIRKGIYVGNKEKQSTVPLLSTLLLSPEELNILKYLLKVKEDKVKSVPRSTSLNSSVTDIHQITELLNSVIINTKPQLNSPPNCTFFKSPKIEIKENEIYIPFVLEKQNSTKDLITGKLHNDGSVRFRISEGNLDGQIDYTSRETLLYGNKLFKQIEKELIVNTLIKEEFYSIKFNSFNNTERIRFFLSFLVTINNTNFSESKLEYILVKPDNALEEELPFDLESLRDKVNHLAITGQGLDTVHFFQDNYKKALLMQRVKIKYDYRILNTQGKCVVDLDFKGALQHGLNEEVELVFNLEIAKKDGQDLEKVSQKLSKAFNSMIQVKYKEKVLIKTSSLSQL